MRRFIQELMDFPKKGDFVLLLLCLITSAFGCIAIASCTAAEKFGDGSIKYWPGRSGLCGYVLH